MKDKALKIIEDWKMFWMNQTQNSEADRKNYFNRAMGVDANMKHHLADMISSEFQMLQAKYDELLKESLEVTGFYGDRKIYNDHSVNISIPNNRKKTCTAEDDSGKRARDFLRKWEKK